MDIFRTEPETAIGLLKQAARKTGIALPAALLDDVEKARQLEVSRPLTVDRDDLGRRLIAHMEAGTDPLDDEDIRRDAMRLALRAAWPADYAQQRANGIRRRSLEAYAPAIIRDWQAACKKAGAAIAKAREAIPGLDLTLSTTTGLPPEHIAAWGDAKQGVSTIAQIAEAWVILAAATGTRKPESARERVLIVADPTLEELDALPQMTPTAVAIAGHPIKLATFAEHQQRTSALNEAITERQAEAEHERSNRLATMRLQ